MRVMFRVVLLFALSVMSVAASASPRGERLPGPVTGEVVNVYDGDTVSIRAHVWIGTAVETSVRIAGIDAPEMKGKCEREVEMAEAARNEIARLVARGPVRITDIQLEKYAGRVLAKVQTADGIDVGDYMLKKGLARAYQGKKREGWCAA